MTMWVQLLPNGPSAAHIRMHFFKCTSTYIHIMYSKKLEIQSIIGQHEHDKHKSLHTLRYQAKGKRNLSGQRLYMQNNTG